MKESETTPRNPEARRNPFTPTFGCIPPELAGREGLIGNIVEGLENAPGDPNRASVFVGARGTGKTVLLASIAESAEALGWVSANMTAREGMLGEIVVQTRKKGGHLLRPETLSRITELHVYGFGFTREVGDAQSTWRSDMTDIVQELNEAGTGLLITVDEASTKSAELGILVDVFQHFVRERRDVALLLAGLPHNISALIDDDATSFLRRAFQHSMDKISTSETAYAMKDTIEGAGRSIEPKALERAAEAAEGYAFLIQLIGYHAWRQSPRSGTISEEDVEGAIRFARRDMERMVLEPTMRDLSPREAEYLASMLEDESESLVADIAQRMGIDANNATQVRRRLIERGVIGSRGRGRVGFDMPMLRGYLEE